MAAISPQALWHWSRIAHTRGHRFLSRALKAVTFVAYRAILPPEAIVGHELVLGHHGLNVVIHPNVTIGRNVCIWHGVTLAVSDSPGSTTRLTIGDDVTIGAGAVIITPYGRSMSIANGVIVGANSVVTSDVAAGMVVAGVPARVLHGTGEGQSRGYR